MSNISRNIPSVSNYTSYEAAGDSTASASAPSSSVASQLAAIEAQYPNLDSDLAKAKADVESTKDSDKWSGLKWYEKAVFFIPPFGPALGVSLMEQNKQMHKDAVRTLNELQAVVDLRSALNQVASSGDYFDA
ncbi:MAG: hypothetical protein VX699_02880 [Myxococcota bacterium]|nr:hypothetical protein [Myxococcota bacterium]